MFVCTLNTQRVVKQMFLPSRSNRNLEVFVFKEKREKLVGERKGNRKKKKEKNALYFSVKVFSTKVLIGDTIFKSPTGDRNAILRGHPSHAKASYFKTLSIGPAPGIEPAIFRCIQALYRLS